MAFVLRHPVSILVVLAALLGTTAVFAFALPQYEPRYENEMIDFSTREYYGPDEVKRVFAAEGIELRERSTFSGIITLSNENLPLRADALQVAVAPRTGTGSWGPELEPYDERFGNLLVTYGGTDDDLLAAVQVAVETLASR